MLWYNMKAGSGVDTKSSKVMDQFQILKAIGNLLHIITSRQFSPAAFFNVK
jgi:hypothetical protein